MKIEELWDIDDIAKVLGGETLDQIFGFNDLKEDGYICPFCQLGHASGDGKKFQVDIFTGNFSCDCGAKGDIIDLIGRIQYVSDDRDIIYQITYSERILPKIKFGVYQHFKGRNYLVYGVARDVDDNGSWRILYRPLYGDHMPSIRLLEEFFETLENGTERFTFLHPA